MRLQTYRSLAILFAALAANVACQSAQKQTFLPPVQAQAPALTPAKAPDPPPQAKAATAPEPPKQQLAPVAPVDPVADLIAHVEREYQSGQIAYQAGKLEDAKKSFDTAVNLLLNASADLRADERLDRELDRVMEGINGLDLLVAQEGDGSQQKQEPAPIDEANELTPAVDQNVKAKAEAEIKSTR